MRTHHASFASSAATLLVAGCAPLALAVLLYTRSFAYAVIAGGTALVFGLGLRGVGVALDALERSQGRRPPANVFDDIAAEREKRRAG